ncbi:tetratricopeptide repeat protein [Thiorhodovibrio frisius]|uniref:protein O-GlcNAc transferase n=1 Tax=Thiorhodovibrio frisius TaxID=631362 RepID=H8Z5A9_9GAMM|nr:tetratricopeptide repeat protein [Thiorhodovibrio frisius]EIC20516.1 putative O-linked N-acetylglucosamine transferase, SPINDLY family [Thiorhodovibrio frisius]WPL21260.1 TPR repeat-containing protein YrrB [Thiorhodovibrio frisius]
MNSSAQIEQIERELAENPGDIGSCLTLVEGYLHQGDLNAALSALERTIGVVGDHPGLVALRHSLRDPAQGESPPPWEQDLGRVTTLAQAGDLQAALALNEQVTRGWPQQAAGWRSLTDIYRQLGRLPDAIAAAREAIALAPGDASGHANLASLLISGGDLAQADASLERALQLDSHLASAHANRARLLRARGELMEAEASYRRALELAPEQPNTHYNLGNLLEELGRVDDAEHSYREALRLQPRFAAAANNLGAILHADGRLEQAREAFVQAIADAPDLADAHLNLGIVTRELNEPEQARGLLEQAVALDPECGDAWHQLGLTQARLEDFEKARDSVERALELSPENADCHLTLAQVHVMLEDYPSAIGCYHNALALTPAHAPTWVALGNAHTSLEQHTQAEEAYRRAITADPRCAQAHAQLGFCLNGQQRYQEALAALDQALALEPDSVLALGTLGRVRMELGQLEASAEAYRRALAREPENNRLRSAMLGAMAYSGHWPPEKLCAEAEQWEHYSLPPKDRQAARERAFQRMSREGRRLRLGLLSNELIVHPVACFLRTWLRELDRSRFEVVLYPAHGRSDDYTGEFQALADHWQPLKGLSDARAADVLLGDQLDLLIDTSGHEAGNRLGVIARRVAPVQCHYIGYYATTGLSQMDYFIGDGVLIPPEHARHFSEKIWRLPRSRYAYEPHESVPAPRWWPDPGGRLWVGSFNNLFKVREESLALWARVLHALPQAHLALKDFKGANRVHQLRVLKALAAQGIDESRVALLRATPSWSEHMAYYNRLDIALDTLPFNSATTAFDALWMGCPLVTLAGDRMAGLQAASALSGLGRTQWVARDEDDYVRIAVELARDVAGRKQIRETQRACMQQGELCDGTGLARALEAAFEAMFARWLCASSARHPGGDRSATRR